MRTLGVCAFRMRALCCLASGLGLIVASGGCGSPATAVADPNDPADNVVETVDDGDDDASTNLFDIDESRNPVELVTDDPSGASGDVPFSPAGVDDIVIGDDFLPCPVGFSAEIAGEFPTDPVRGVAPMTVVLRAESTDGGQIPSGTYIWVVDGEEFSGPSGTHSALELDLESPGRYFVSLRFMNTSNVESLSCLSTNESSTIEIVADVEGADFGLAGGGGGGGGASVGGGGGGGGGGGSPTPACSSDAACSDGLFCNGEEVCSGGTCVAGTVPCPADQCDESTNTCAACSEHADCDDGLFCNGLELCVNGECRSTITPCSDQVCDEENDGCVACLENSDCDDGVFCNGAEVCNNGSCESGAAVCAGQQCDENDDACVDCLSNSDCDDGNFCNGSEVCNNNVCAAGSDPCPTQECNENTDACVDCLSHDDCNDNAFCNGFEFCFNGSCMVTSAPCQGEICDETNDVCVECENNSDCDDGVFCNGAETCNGGTCEAGAAVCVGQQCNENDDACVACLDNSDCDDDLFCNGIETCNGGVCQPGTAVCGAQLCDETNDECVTCLDSDDCDDGLFCNGVETCTGGMCMMGSAPCSGQMCNEAADACVDCLNSGDCSDGNFCNGSEICAGGICVNGPAPCSGQECNENNDTCVDCLNNADCSDGNFCNGSEICFAGNCIAGSAPCNGQECNENTNQCVDCLNNADCNDGNFCNGAETCNNGTCVSGSSPCAGQFCIESSDSCVDCILNSQCNDGVFCNGTETCTGGSCQAGTPPCSGQECNENTDQCVDCLNHDDCDDNVYCNGQEVCFNGACVAGSNPCPGEFCDETQDDCDECINNSHCDDGVYCNGAETCSNGTCQSGSDPCPGEFCDEGQDDCDECVNNTHCDDGLYCNGSETCVNGACVAGSNPCTGGATCEEATDSCSGGDAGFAYTVSGLPVDLRGNTPENETVTVNITSLPAGATHINITMTVFDADHDEGRLVINGSNTINLWGANTSGANDGITVTLNPYEVPVGWFQIGSNSFQFWHESTGGFVVEQMTLSVVIDDNAICDINSDCNDGAFCNGVETCDNGTCVAGSSPCQAGEVCDETNDACNAVAGNVYYVDDNGSSQPGFNSSAPLGSINNPFDNIQAAVVLCGPGDTVLIRDGTYVNTHLPTHEVRPVIEPQSSGVAGSPITIRNYDPANETVIVDAEGSHLECVKMENKSHIVLEGLTAINAKGRNFKIVNSTYITIRDCTASDNITGNQAGFDLQGRTQHCLLERCISTRNGRGFLLSGSPETSDPSQNNRPRFNTIRNCIAYENTRDEEDSDGFQMLASSDNEFVNCVAYSNGDDGFDFTRGSHRNKMIRCIAYNHPFNPNGDGDGNGFKIGVWGQAPADSEGGGADCEMSHCIAFDNKYGLNNNAVRLKISHSVFYNNTSWGVLHDESTGHDGQATMKNCISTNNGGDVGFSFAPDNPIAEADYNYFGDGTSNNDHSDVTGQDANSLFGATDGPVRFVNPNNPGIVLDMSLPNFPYAPGFELQANSPCRDAGVADGQDFSAVGAGFDMGVYEYTP